MKNKKTIVQLICQGLITMFLVSNIVIAAITKECTLFAYICCNILAILQSLIIMDTYLEESRK